jgi:hypothetical protein
VHLLASLVIQVSSGDLNPQGYAKPSQLATFPATWVSNFAGCDVSTAIVETGLVATVGEVEEKWVWVFVANQFVERGESCENGTSR